MAGAHVCVHVTDCSLIHFPSTSSYHDSHIVEYFAVYFLLAVAASSVGSHSENVYTLWLDVYVDGSAWVGTTPCCTVVVSLVFHPVVFL